MMYVASQQFKLVRSCAFGIYMYMYVYSVQSLSYDQTMNTPTILQSVLACMVIQSSVENVAL